MSQGIHFYFLRLAGPTQLLPDNAISNRIITDIRPHKGPQASFPLRRVSGTTPERRKPCGRLRGPGKGGPIPARLAVSRSSRGTGFPARYGAGINAFEMRKPAEFRAHMRPELLGETRRLLQKTTGT